MASKKPPLPPDEGTLPRVPPKNARVPKLTLAVAGAAPLPTHDAYTLYCDTNKHLGLALRIYASGAKTWIVQKKLQGQTRRITLDSLTAMNYTQAVLAAEKKYREIKDGLDPRLELTKRKEQTKAELEKRELTVQGAFETFCRDKAGRPATVRGRQDAMRKLETGALWRKSLVVVTGRDLLKEYQRLIASVKAKYATDGTAQAGNIFRVLRAAVNHALTETQYTGHPNPFVEFKRLAPAGWDKTKSRKGVVVQSPEKFKRWWAAVEDLRPQTADAETIADYLQLTLCFGNRKTELLSLRWENVDIEDRFVRFVEESTKGAREHIIPYGTYAQSILERRNAVNWGRTPEDRSEYVFNASRAGRSTINPETGERIPGKRTWLKEPKKRIAEVSKAADIDFASHDLRRSFASLLNALNINTLTIDKALNHAANDVTGKHYIVTLHEEVRPLYQKLEDLLLQTAGIAIAAPPPQTELVLRGEQLAEYLQLLAAAKSAAAAAKAPDGNAD